MMGKANIRRYDPEKNVVPYWQEYEFDYQKGMTVLDVVMQIQQNCDATLTFGHACRNGHCGLCSARINGRPGLMCREPAQEVLTLEPLKNVPVIRDLLVDFDSYTSRETSERSFLERFTPPSEEPERVDMQGFDLFRVTSRCVRCLDCLSVCPAYQAAPHEYIGPAMLIRLARHLFDPRDEASRELTAYEEGLFYCTGCGACSTVCPHDIDPAKMIATMKQRTVSKGLIPPGISAMAESLAVSKSAFTPSRGHPTFISDSPELIEAVGPSKGRVGLFVGCLINTDPRLRHVAESAILVLTHLGWDVFIPKGQICCGLPFHEAGLDSKAKSFAEHNVSVFREEGITEVITVCSGCGSTAKNVWPEQLEASLPFKVYDFNEFVEERLDPAGRSMLSKHLHEVKVTYHDPCTLNRGQNITKQPRDLLNLVPGLHLIESADADRCCGGGGSVPLTNPALADAMAAYKAEDVLKTGAEKLVTACPTCMRRLSTALRKKGTKMEVLHVADVLATQIERR